MNTKLFSKKIIICFLSLTCLFSCATNNNLSENLQQEEKKEEIQIDYAKEYREKTKDIFLEVLKTPLGSTKNKPWDSPYILKVKNQENQGMSDVGVGVHYPVSRINDQITFATGNLISDKEGLVTFWLESPVLAMDENITFYLMPKELMSKENVPMPMEEDLQKAIEEKSLVLPFKVRTNYLSKGGAISIVDYDKEGNVVTTNSKSSSALLSAMMNKGFSKIGNIDFTKQITKDTSALYSAAKSVLNGISSYLIYGTIRYIKVPSANEEGMLCAEIEASLSCMEIKDGSIFYSTTRQYEGKAKTQSLLEDVLRKTMATDMANVLLYSM